MVRLPPAGHCLGFLQAPQPWNQAGSSSFNNCSAGRTLRGQSKQAQGGEVLSKVTQPLAIKQGLELDAPLQPEARAGHLGEPLETCWYMWGTLCGVWGLGRQPLRGPLGRLLPPATFSLLLPGHFFTWTQTLSFSRA